MSERPRDLDALFERDADSRLLERRRSAELGLAPHAPAASRTQAQFGAESIRDDDESSAPPRPASLRGALEARPRSELIPGALVTIVLTVANDGESEAKDVRVRIALPPEAEPVAGSFARDEIAIDGEALLGEGLPIGTLAPGGASRLRVAVQILPGTEPLDVVASASAPGVPAVGAPTLRLQRRAGHAAYAQPKPFYELEDDEHDEELVAEAAPEPPRTVDTVSDAPAAPPVVAAPAPPPPSPPAPPVPPPPVPAALLTRAITLDDVRALDRVFAGGVPHGLAALALLSALACDGGPLGDALGVAAFRTSVAAALPRALVAARMRKPTPPVVTPAALAEIRAEGRADAPAPSLDAPALVVRLDANELDALRAVLRRDLDDPFLRGMQVLVALFPHELHGVAPTGPARCVEALSAFRVTVSAWLMRVTVRRSVDRRYDPLTAEDAALRDAGAALVTVLREVLSAT
ncbi:MAG TPA: hypothetical protein VMA36_16565 [Candidatus Limnocylindria bacterium]|nr:hypothetical protein [Candidatus Limnocylindria bacterium]